MCARSDEFLCVCVRVWQVNKLNWKMIVSSLLTFIVYFLSVILLRQYFDVSYITGIFFLKVLAIVAIAWGPPHIWKVVYQRCDPSDHKKIMLKK